MTDRWRDELAELVAIPSVSADPDRADAVRAAAGWMDDCLRRGGAASEVVDWNGQPLVIGALPASHDAGRAPTVLLYGHVDVQGEQPLELWESDPFGLEVRGEWAYGRGVVDDKGSLYLLVRAACELAADGALPVNVRFAIDAEEESLGRSVVEYLEADPAGADACLIYDWNMSARDMPEIAIGTRGNVVAKLTVRTGERDVHSGAAGGAALNAVHALTQTLAGVLARDGRLREELREGVLPASAEELRAHARLPSGEQALAALGARPADARAAAEYHARVQLEPTVEVIGIVGGSPEVKKTIVPACAEARLSARLAAGQDPEVVGAALERLLRESAPAGAELVFERDSLTPPSLFSPDTPAIQLAGDAFERATGTRPVLARAGGTLPLMAALQARGIPAVLTGFGLPESNVHAPNERLLVRYVPLGIQVAKEILRSFGQLPRSPRERA